MKNLKSYLPIVLAAVGIVSLPTTASAVSFKAMGDSFTDNVFRSEMDSGAFTELFVAESRIGNNNASNGDYELSINNPPGGGTDKQSQYKWISGEAVNFSLEYTGSVVNYTVGNTLLSSTNFSGDINKIYLRTRGSGDNKPAGSISLSNLIFNGQSYSPGLSSIGTSAAADVDYLAITGINTPFKLTGTSTLTFNNGTPNGSHLAYQIKVGTSTSEEVPEPLTILGTVAALGFGVGFKKKHSQQ